VHHVQCQEAEIQEAEITMTIRIRAIAILTALVLACAGNVTDPARPAAWSGDERRENDRRDDMVTQLQSRGITNPLVLKAMREVPRHLFVPEAQRAHAYEDRALPVGEHQTISQPYVVALMTQLARVEPGEKVLEVGTGSGYQAAVLARMGARVYTIEIIPTLAHRARKTLDSLGYRTIEYRVGDGYRGWPEAAPFGTILVTAAPDHVPQPLVDQLAVGGRLVIPVGASTQELMVITRSAEGTRSEQIIPVQFVPMKGEAERRPK
jgi:protein-L-isoaspartate(D-aspartate) O-methyltransferase